MRRLRTLLPIACVAMMLLSVAPAGAEVVWDHTLTDPVDDVAGSAYFVSFVEDRMLYEDVRVDFVASRYIDEIELHVSPGTSKRLAERERIRKQKERRRRRGRGKA